MLGFLVSKLPSVLRPFSGLTMSGVSMGGVTVPFLKDPGKRIIFTHDGSMGLEYLPNYR